LSKVLTVKVGTRTAAARTELVTEIFRAALTVEVFETRAVIDTVPTAIAVDFGKILRVGSFRIRGRSLFSKEVLISAKLQSCLQAECFLALG